MKILEITNDYDSVIKETARVILNGGLVVFPSDTVYILAVDPTNEIAVKKLLAFKNRWVGKAISMAVLDIKMAKEYVELNINQENIYKNLLPGPFTIINKGKHKVAKGIEAENGSLGIRIPDNKYISDLIKITKKPITATSANLSGRTPNYSIASFLRPLSSKKKGVIDLIINGGKLAKNKPSTVIDTIESEIKVLRRGDLVTGSTKETLISKSEKETEKIAEFLLHKSNLPPSPFFHKTGVKQNNPLVFLLSGDLGCGKTVFSRKIGHLLGVKEKIVSPTFVIYNEYKIQNPSVPTKVGTAPLDEREQSLKQNWKFLHMDLYKITTERDLEEIKFLDLFSENTISCIEWPENMGEKYLKELKKRVKIVSVNFRYVNQDTREIRY